MPTFFVTSSCASILLSGQYEESVGEGIGKRKFNHRNISGPVTNLMPPLPIFAR